MYYFVVIKFTSFRWLSSRRSDDLKERIVYQCGVECQQIIMPTFAVLAKLLIAAIGTLSDALKLHYTAA